MALKSIGLGLALILTSSALTAPCDGGTPQDTQWSEGNYYAQSVYTFTFRTDPYVLTMNAYTSGDDDSGAIWGEFNWLFWVDEASHMSGAPPDCILTDSITGVPHPRSSADLDYSTCPDCDPFSGVTQTYLSATGPNCTPELVAFWTIDAETGEPFEDFTDVWGYTHAATDGWPAEFASIADSLEASGYVGTLSSLLLDGDAFAPLYVVQPLVGEVRPSAQRIVGAPTVELSSPRDLR